MARVRPWGLLLFSLQPHLLFSAGLLLFRTVQNFSEVLVWAALPGPFEYHFPYSTTRTHTWPHTCAHTHIHVINSHLASGISENLYSPHLGAWGLLPAPQSPGAPVCCTVSSRQVEATPSRVISNAQHPGRLPGATRLSGK